MRDIMEAGEVIGLTADQREAMRSELERRALEAEKMPETWPPLRLNRATRRACKHRIKAGFCVDCGEGSAPNEGSTTNG